MVKIQYCHYKVSNNRGKLRRHCGCILTVVTEDFSRYVMAYMVIDTKLVVEWGLTVEVEPLGGEVCSRALTVHGLD